MRTIILTLACVALASCQQFSDDQEVADSADLTLLAAQLADDPMQEYRLGHPDGVASDFVTTGVVSDDEFFDSAEGLVMRNGSAVAGLHLANMVLLAESWQQAHEEVQAYVASPPDEVAAMPPHILPQVAAQSMFYNSDLAAPGEVSEERLVVLEHYLDAFIDNRFPDPEPAAALLALVAPHWSAERTAEASRVALAAYRLDVARIEACEDCGLRQAMNALRAEEIAPDVQMLELFANAGASSY